MVSGATADVFTCDTYFNFSGSDDVTIQENLLFAYTYDGSDWSDYSTNTNVVFDPLPEGYHEFSVRAMDETGKVDPTPAYRAFFVDAFG